MSLLNFPNEVLYMIAKRLKAKDTNALLLTNKFFAQLATPLLYDILIEDKDGLPALCWAAQKGYYQWCQSLLKMGASTSTRCSSTHLTALHFAAQSGHESIISLLLNYGAEIEALDNAVETPLHCAARGGNTAAAYTLLQRGANIDAVNQSHKTALSKAIKLLVKACCREYESQEARAGVFTRAEETAIMLLENGANVHLSNIYGEMALHEACGQSSVSIVKLILDKGGILEARENQGNTALHIAAMYGWYEISRFLLERNANIDAANNNGDTPLHLAVKLRRESVIELLVEEGANTNLINTSNFTALALAAYRGSEGIVCMILKGNPCFESTCNAQALYIAVKHGFDGVTKLLLENGAQASINIQWHPKDQTVLHQAVQKGYVDVARILLENGADMMIMDADKKCPLCMAVEQDSEELIELFIEYRKDSSI